MPIVSSIAAIVLFIVFVSLLFGPPCRLNWRHATYDARIPSFRCADAYRTTSRYGIVCLVFIVVGYFLVDVDS
jgi:hypothetical protein